MSLEIRDIATALGAPIGMLLFDWSFQYEFAVMVRRNRATWKYRFGPPLRALLMGIVAVEVAAAAIFSLSENMFIVATMFAAILAYLFATIAMCFE